MLNLTLFVLIMASFVYMGVLYGNTALILGAFAGVLLFVFSCVYLMFQGFFLHFRFTIPISMVQTGQTVDAELEIDNRGIFPVSKMRVLFQWENTLTGETGKLHIKGAANAAGKTVVYFQVKGADCGSYRYRLKRIRVYDLSGVFYLKRRSKVTVEFCVMPEIYQTGIQVSEASRHFMGDIDDCDGSRGGGDGMDILQIRPFREGDKIQKIHWKMSAKEDELMVKENSFLMGCPVVLFLDTGGNGMNLNVFLALLSTLSLSLLEQKCKHYIAWQSSSKQDLTRYRIDTEESLYLFLLIFYGDESKTVPPDLRSAYWEKYRGETAVTEILINRKLEIYMGETLFLKVSRYNLRKDLEEVEFIV